MTRWIKPWIPAAAAFGLTLSLGAQGRAETLCGAGADVAPETVVVIGLTTGDTLVVIFAGCSGDIAIVDHELLGRLNIHPDAVAEVVAAKPGEDLIVDVQVFTDRAEPALAEPPAETAAEKSKVWSSQAEFGLSGSEGNSERLSIRLGARSKRATEGFETTFDVAYMRSDEASDGNDRETTENKAFANANNDWLFRDSPWRYFLGVSLEADEFQDYDVRLGASTGPGYAFIDNAATSLIARAGISTSSKIGGEGDDTFFELVCGYDFEHALTANQKIVSSARIFPNMSQSGEYRAVASLAYDLSLSVPAALTLRLGIEDRYDSTIEDTVVAMVVTEEFEKNDFDYYATLIWDF